MIKSIGFSCKPFSLEKWALDSTAGSQLKNHTWELFVINNPRYYEQTLFWENESMLVCLKMNFMLRFEIIPSNIDGWKQEPVIIGRLL